MVYEIYLVLDDEHYISYIIYFIFLSHSINAAPVLQVATVNVSTASLVTPLMK